jgi:uncharacterized protein (UPF0303 family)
MNDASETDRWKRTYEQALAQEQSLDFQRFSHTDAWELGGSMVARAVEAIYPVAIAIKFGQQRIFHAALPGSSATNDDWLDRKFRAVELHNCSSWALACQQRAAGADYFAASGYDRRAIALAGGAVPLRVQGSLVGAVGVSGLAEEDDHRFVVDALGRHLATITVGA